jgi:hypothetical protein
MMLLGGVLLDHFCIAETFLLSSNNKQKHAPSRCPTFRDDGTITRGRYTNACSSSKLSQSKKINVWSDFYPIEYSAQVLIKENGKGV